MAALFIKDFPSDVLADLKILAIRHNTTLRALIIQLLIEYCQQRKGEWK
jgi:hypothetical protein